jgi:hypothetical protein
VTAGVIPSRGYGRSPVDGALLATTGHGYIGRRSREGLVCAMVVMSGVARRIDRLVPHGQEDERGGEVTGHGLVRDCSPCLQSSWVTLSLCGDWQWRRLLLSCRIKNI